MHQLTSFVTCRGRLAQVTTIVGDLLGLMRGLEALDPLAYRQLLASNLETGAEEVPKQVSSHALQLHPLLLAPYKLTAVELT